MRLHCRYGELEQVSFRESLAAVRLPELGEDLVNAMPSLNAFAGATENALGAALERCQQVTGTLQPQYNADGPICKFCLGILVEQYYSATSAMILSSSWLSKGPTDWLLFS